MEKKCRECFRICKWLESTDTPKKYSFDFLKPRQILSVIERRFREHRFMGLVLDNLAESEGNQLALSLSSVDGFPSPEDVREPVDATITLIAQCESTLNGTELCLRFGVEDALCEKPFVMDDFHSLLNDILESLAAADFLMSACPERDLKMENGQQ